MVDECDDRLRERLIAGEADALADAYDQHAPAVYGVAMRMLGEPTAAEDIVQEVFLGLWEHPSQYDPGRGRMRAWLCAAARYRAIDQLRRAEVRNRYLPLLVDRVTALDAEESTIQDVLTKAVRGTVAELPESHRAAILLAYYGGLTYPQVAATLGIAEGTAKSRLRQALRTLATRLAEEGVLER